MMISRSCSFSLLPSKKEQVPTPWKYIGRAPGLYIKRPRVNHNGRITDEGLVLHVFNAEKNTFVCRHMERAFSKGAPSHRGMKDILEKHKEIGTACAFYKGRREVLEKNCRDMGKLGKEFKRYFDPQRFGDVINHLSDGMEIGDVRVFPITVRPFDGGIGHALALYLRRTRKGENEVGWDVDMAGLYDPNNSANLVHVKRLHGSSATHNITDFIPYLQKYSHFEVSSSHAPFKVAVDHFIDQDREIVTKAGVALHYGDTALLKCCIDFIKKNPDDKSLIKDAIHAIQSVQGLSYALNIGHVRVVGALRELLELVPEEERAALLKAKCSDGNPGLYFALANGHADVVREFGALLKLVPEKERAALLEAKCNGGNPGLYFALQQGHADVVREFGKILELVPEAERAALLMAKDINGESGLYFALEYKKTAALNAYCDVVKGVRLGKNDAAQLLQVIRNCYGRRCIFWFNSSAYNELIKQDPAFYRNFKSMDDHLEKAAH